MKYRYRVLSFLFFLSMITYVDRVCINYLGLQIQTELELTPKHWSWVIGAFTLSYALFEIPTGAWGDRYGPRRTASRIVLWWSVFTSLTGAVHGFYQLVICRFLFGGGEAGAFPNCAAAISRWFPLKERARATGVVWMASRLGGAISPIIVLTLSAWLGWRWTFAVFGALGLCWVTAWYWWFRDLPSEKPGVTAEELAEIGDSGSREHQGMPWRVALRDSNFWVILAMYHCYCWGSFFYLGFMVDYLRHGRGFSDGDLKAIAWLPFACGACGNLFGGWMSDRLSKQYGLRPGRRWIGSLGLALAGAFMLTTYLISGKYIALVLLAIGYGCMDAMLPVAWAVCLDIGKRYAGAVSGSMNMAGQLGSFLSTLAFGYTVSYLMSTGTPKPEAYNFPLLPFSIMLFVSAALFLKIDPEKQLVPEAESAGGPAPPGELRPTGATAVR